MAQDINNVCDYIITMCEEGGEHLNLLKLQKLLYYVQAWHLAFKGTRLFDGKFEAWVHGPVSRQIYERFAGDKTLYSPVGACDVRPGFDFEKALLPAERLHIDSVLEVYASFSGSELEAEAHTEAPWITARGKCKPSERCTTELDETLMQHYYAARLTE